MMVVVISIVFQIRYVICPNAFFETCSRYSGFLRMIICILYIVDLSCHYVGGTPLKFSRAKNTEHEREVRGREKTREWQMRKGPKVHSTFLLFYRGGGR
jgi:hypothetical protein